MSESKKLRARGSSRLRTRLRRGRLPLRWLDRVSPHHGLPRGLRILHKRRLGRVGGFIHDCGVARGADADPNANFDSITEPDGIGVSITCGYRYVNAQRVWVAGV